MALNVPEWHDIMGKAVDTPGRSGYKNEMRMRMPANDPRRYLPTPLYVTDHGAAYVGDSLDLLRCFPDRSVNLILTSPPFALTRKKEYGNFAADEYVDWFLKFAKDFHRSLTDDGSFVLDLGGAYLPGHPVRTIYQYELLIRLCKEFGFYLAQEFFHYNPARLPAPAEWVNVRRLRVKDSVNVVWWLSKGKNPKADNRRVLRPYGQSMRQLLKNGYKAMLRPSGHDISTNFSKDNNGAIPPNLIELANTESNSSYLRSCKEHGVKPHPARFPAGFPEFFLKFTTDPNDLVLDAFAGSNTTGWVAERMGRRWVSIDLNAEYLEASRFRFEDSDNLFPVTRPGRSGAKAS